MESFVPPLTTHLRHYNELERFHLRWKRSRGKTLILQGALCLKSGTMTAKDISKVQPHREASRHDRVLEFGNGAVALCRKGAKHGLSWFLLGMLGIALPPESWTRFIDIAANLAVVGTGMVASSAALGVTTLAATQLLAKHLAKRSPALPSLAGPAQQHLFTRSKPTQSEPRFKTLGHCFAALALASSAVGMGYVLVKSAEVQNPPQPEEPDGLRYSPDGNLIVKQKTGSALRLG